MENKKVIKLLEEIRDLLKANQSKYDNYLAGHRKMQTEYLKKVLIFFVIFILIIFYLISKITLPAGYY